MNKQVWISLGDFPSAQVAHSSCDMILVGDSLAMTLYGLSSTREITLETMLLHYTAVQRAVSENFPLVFDMPFGSYNSLSATKKSLSPMRDAGISRVKIEGGKEILPQLSLLLSEGFEVVGHLGLLPQTAETFSLQGTTKKDAECIFRDAHLLQKAGVSHLVLECIPESLGKKITNTISLPTIGIGAGRFVDGQILLFSDLVGRTQFTKKPRFVRSFGSVREEEQKAVQLFSKSVREGGYPEEKEVY